MASSAELAFRKARDRARLLVAASRGGAVQMMDLEYKDTCLHAALAMLVAAWEAYLESLVVETQRLMADPTHQRFAAALSLLTSIATKEIKKFNTPNAENSRNLLLVHTGFDALNAWHWSAGGLNALQSRQRLDEILKVRHCFAHGAAIPTDVQWACNRNRHGHLTQGALGMADRFLTHMVNATDIGMANHLTTVFGVPRPW